GGQNSQVASNIHQSSLFVVTHWLTATRKIYPLLNLTVAFSCDLFCFNRHKEGELNMGENSCIDRCVSKYSGD
uniref:Mitochondrial import inner membrane translocase subunit n=1 Tax=Aegilops tauschii subsp. strangulata TaxID=200361 RepID=A0A453MB12_AEGTS